MRGFRFRLDPLLRLRRHQLEQARRALAGARAQLALCEQEAQLAQERAGEAARALEERSGRGLAADHYRASQAAAGRHVQATRRAQLEASRQRQRVAQARARVVEAHRTLRALEILRDKALEAYRAEELRREQRQLDEVGARLARRAAHTGSAP